MSYDTTIVPDPVVQARAARCAAERGITVAEMRAIWRRALDQADPKGHLESGLAGTDIEGD